MTAQKRRLQGMPSNNAGSAKSKIRMDCRYLFIAWKLLECSYVSVTRELLASHPLENFASPLDERRKRVLRGCSGHLLGDLPLRAVRPGQFDYPKWQSSGHPVEWPSKRK